jgi:hypothetical protein
MINAVAPDGLMRRGWMLGLPTNYSRNRTPGPPLLPAAMNLTPAFSSALRMALIVRGKSSSPRSKRVMVFVETFAAAASCLIQSDCRV